MAAPLITPENSRAGQLAIADQLAISQSRKQKRFTQHFLKRL